MRTKRLVFLVAFIFVFSQAAFAARLVVHEAAESPQYGKKAAGMLGRGVLNVATCFVDLLVHVVKETRDGPPLVGTLVGVGRGVGCTTLRALSGGVDVITFWVPGFNGFPVSDSYDNCVPSEGPEEFDSYQATQIQQQTFVAPIHVPTDEPGAAQAHPLYPFSTPVAPAQEIPKPTYTK
jgi:putative exosortase-associated protein (TIGR04073 family)